MERAAGMANVDSCSSCEGLAPRERWEFGLGSAGNLGEGWHTIVSKPLIPKGGTV